MTKNILCRKVLLVAQMSDNSFCWKMAFMLTSQPTALEQLGSKTKLGGFQEYKAGHGKKYLDCHAPIV